MLWGEVDARIAEWTRQRELEVEMATFKAWFPPAEHSMRSSPGRPGTG